MEYTNSQKELLKKINNFFNSDLDIFIIKGYAGTGKTFITKIIIESLQKAKTNFSLMAPTGKATKVLSEKTNEIANTIHSSIYAIDKTDIENKKLYFSLKQNNLVNSYFIVDEASMISNINNETDSLKFGSGKLLKDLLEFVNFSKKNKLILIGDTAQLPPVKMNESPALLKETFLEYGFKVDDFLMTDVVRQKDNSILENATYLRDKIKDGILIKYLNRVMMLYI
jgi:tRNA A37 threonylcarbamoyladenosine biosynthesis protein TsaE